MHVELEGQVAIVTGAAGAIGSAIARRLDEAGAAVVVADVNLPGAEAGAATLRQALAVRLDITDETEVRAGIAATLERFGRLDILVNNAGVNSLAHRVTIEDYPPEEWHRITSIDLDGLYQMSRLALPTMLAQGYGRVINIASVVGLAAMRLQSPFVAAKAGIVHLTRSMALELGSRGILTNAIAPGSVLSEGTRSLFYGADGKFAARTEEFMRHIPMGRPGTGEEIAEAVLFFASPAAGYVNGQILAVDGGWTAGYMM
jgi:3-oxoacyl-[acyl-carrier protein] reductase/2-deoxy-D-gluconate 3-dehydrogenase